MSSRALSRRTTRRGLFKREKAPAHVVGRHHRLKLPPGLAGSGGPGGPGAGTLQKLSQEMVDRLFWRAGFGPTPQDRTTWTGRNVTDAVNYLLSTPQGALAGADPTNNGKALDPTGNDTDLVLQWIDRMIRVPNPFPERMAFFWHRHFGNSRDSVSPPQLIIAHIGLFRRYADFGANPAATFKNLAYEVTEDPSMLRFLNGEENVKGGPNENYARELMELFCLGVVNAAGAKNYSESDVQQLAKALSGWQIDDTNPDAARAYFSPSRWFNGPKNIFGKLANYQDRDAADVVLAHPAHAAFLVSKIWHEFVVSDPDPATLADLTGTYTSSGFQLKPLLAKILSHPALFESISEPNMVKPPVVYAIGMMRALGLGVTDTTVSSYLDDMGQLPYYPPTVAGWEGGLSWLNTNTALARFGFANQLVNKTKPQDVTPETPQAAFDRAYGAIGSPWLADGTKAQLLDLATRAPAKTPADRIARQITLRALMLAGPDGQVM